MLANSGHRGRPNVTKFGSIHTKRVWGAIYDCNWQDLAAQWLGDFFFFFFFSFFSVYFFIVFIFWHTSLAAGAKGLGVDGWRVSGTGVYWVHDTRIIDVINELVTRPYLNTSCRVHVAFAHRDPIINCSWHVLACYQLEQLQCSMSIRNISRKKTLDLDDWSLHYRIIYIYDSNTSTIVNDIFSRRVAHTSPRLSVQKNEVCIRAPTWSTLVWDDLHFKHKHQICGGSGFLGGKYCLIPLVHVAHFLR